MIHYLKGDATDPKVKGNKIIAHICNDIGAWGAGFVLALSKRWSSPEKLYRHWADSGSDSFSLGNIQLVSVEKDIWVANMIAQRGVGYHNGYPPVRYWAVERVLKELGEEAYTLDATIHMPRIGCGLAGGKWREVEPLIDTQLCYIDVFIYDLK